MKRNILLICLFLCISGTFAQSIQSTQLLESTKSQVLAEYNNNTIVCDVCEFIVTIINIDIKYSNSTIHLLEDIIDFICYVEPQPVKKTCNEILNDFDLLIDFIMKVFGKFSPNDICKKLNYC